MDVSSEPDGRPEYKSPKHAQIWFLFRSRSRLKAKYRQLKKEEKRLKNRVHDVTRSREAWREDAERLGQQAEQLEAENARLRDQLERLKKR
jgi:chromosome segregation ATPase